MSLTRCRAVLDAQAREKQWIPKIAHGGEGERYRHGKGEDRRDGPGLAVQHCRAEDRGDRLAGPGVLRVPLYLYLFLCLWRAVMGAENSHSFNPDGQRCVCDVQ